MNPFGELGDGLRARLRTPQRHPRPGPGSTGRLDEGGDVFRRIERLAQRPVEMRNPTRTSYRLGEGAGCERAGQTVGDHSGVGHRQLVEPTHVRAVEPRLLDRLSGAAIAELRGAIGGQHDQRDTAVARLDDRREIVRRRGARRADQGSRDTGHSRHTEREEAGRALVEMNRAAQFAARFEQASGHRERRRTRARRDADVAHSRPFEPGQEREGRRVGRATPGLRRDRVHAQISVSCDNRVRNLRRVSASSASGTDAATRPAPANSRATQPSISPERSAPPRSPPPVAST